METQKRGNWQTVQTQIRHRVYTVVLTTGIFIKHSNNKTPLLEIDESKELWYKSPFDVNGLDYQKKNLCICKT